ncbi:Potassium voltage-gated channel subfamily H member 2 [Eumeta japonica]|uniref:Potassium voltage-gated channel subfamily H member 2 n=1 Tax=Eumeta variegata TaxID=151549 RepID=A0A4C1VU79_EUMVA|nr:Potassium voltage-gated channel subfamily H member 2 [Eumeta japonica]
MTALDTSSENDRNGARQPSEFELTRATSPAFRCLRFARTLVAMRSADERPLERTQTAAWDWLILILVIYTAIFTPYVAAFQLNEPDFDKRSRKFGEDPIVVIDMIGAEYEWYMSWQLLVFVRPNRLTSCARHLPCLLFVLLSLNYIVQRTKICRCEINHENVAVAQNYDPGERKKRPGNKKSAQCIIRRPSTTAEFRAL